MGNAPYLSVFDASQLRALTLLVLEAHSYGYAVGLVFFGVHCLILGALVLKSTYVPGALGILLLVAGAGYLVDSFGRTLLPDYAVYETMFAVAVFVPAFIAELSFALWLVIKGGSLRTPQALA